MTNERGNQSHPPVTGHATYQAELGKRRAREKARTREGDAIAAACPWSKSTLAFR